MKCLFNTNSRDVVGYCLHHHCGVTENQMVCKHCCEKKCRHFKKNENSPYWKKKELKKQQRKNRKKRINDYVHYIQSGVKAV